MNRRQDRIQAVAGRDDAYRAAGVGKGRKGQTKQLVATVCRRNLIRFKVVKVRHNLPKLVCQRIKIALEGL